MSSELAAPAAEAPGLRSRVAAAPISWGVSEVPQWGHQLPADRVLDEMRALGLAATEFGPDGFLADGPAAKAAQLRQHGMRAIGGFLPVLLHDPDHDPVPEVDRFLDDCLAAGADVMVLAAVSGADGYDATPDLDDAGWSTLLANLDRLTDRATSRGAVATLHPHVGTLVTSRSHVERFLSGSRIGLCLDTGHLRVGGADPVALVAEHAERVTHVHLKDVDAGLADRVGSGELAFGDAVRDGIFRPLGQGDLDIAALVRSLESVGYQGWYVLEQDVMLDADPAGTGPAADVRTSLEFIERLIDGSRPR